MRAPAPMDATGGAPPVRTRERAGPFHCRMICEDGCTPTPTGRLLRAVCAQCGAGKVPSIGRYIHAQERRLFRWRDVSISWEPREPQPEELAE